MIPEGPKLLNAYNGLSGIELRGAKAIYPGQESGLALIVWRKRFGICRVMEWSPLWHCDMRSFAVLAAAFSPTAVVVSEAGGSLRAFDLEGRALWEIGNEPGAHMLCVAWNAMAQTWFAVQYPYQTGGISHLVTITENGAISHRHSIPALSEGEFFDQGRLLVDINGRVIDASSGELLWQFTEPHSHLPHE